mmetsp:Transcript_7511/g.11619  ORF Transcript_7511/g.11619 Transcript_7511/m.11619 type:complete len:84 (+) Transcript_7511:188-439(+)
MMNLNKRNPMMPQATIHPRYYRRRQRRKIEIRRNHVPGGSHHGDGHVSLRSRKRELSSREFGLHRFHRSHLLAIATRARANLL